MSDQPTLIWGWLKKKFDPKERILQKLKQVDKEIDLLKSEKTLIAKQKELKALQDEIQKARNSGTPLTP